MDGAITGVCVVDRINLQASFKREMQTGRKL